MTTKATAVDASDENDLLGIARLALDDLKALDPVVMDVRSLSSVMDYLVIASGTSSRHVKSLAENVLMKAKEQGFKLLMRLWPFLRQDKMAFVLMFLLSPIGAALALSQPYIIKQVIDVHIMTGVMDGINQLLLMYFWEFCSPTLVT